MRPDDRAAGIVVHWIEQMRATDFLVLLGCEFCDNQVAAFAEEKCFSSRRVFHDKRISPARGLPARRLERFPKALARLQLQAAELSVAARPVDVAGVAYR